jgi:hypothetical protein
MSEPRDFSELPVPSKTRIPLWLIVIGGVAFLIFSLSLGGLTWWLIIRERSRANVPSTAQPVLTDNAANEPAVDATPPATILEPGFTSLFNGRDLDAWVGDSAVWSVQNGVIRGRSKTKLGAGNWTCLFWQGRQIKDFELRFSFRLVSGNSGVFFRSRQLENFSAAGYQFDIYPNVVGNLLDIGRGRPRRDLSRTQRSASGWHDATIIATGNRIIHKLDGETLCDIDDSIEDASREGWIALELAGGPTTVEFKNIRLRQFNPDTPQ